MSSFFSFETTIALPESSTSPSWEKLCWVHIEIASDMFQLKHFSLEMFKHQPAFRRPNLNF